MKLSVWLKDLRKYFFPVIPNLSQFQKLHQSLKLLQHVRDEAHRFAITFHRQRRSKRNYNQRTLEIKGIGEKIVQKLLTKYSLEEIKKNGRNTFSRNRWCGKAKLIVEFIRKVKGER